MVTWRGTFVWNKKMSMKQSVHPQLNVCKRQQGLSIYLIFTNFVWWILRIFGFVFRLKKWDTEGNSEDDSKGDPEENCLRTTLTRNEKISMKENDIVNCNYRQTWFKNCNWHCFQCISFISCFQIIFSLTFYLFSDKEEEEEGGKVRRQWKRLASE